MPDIAGDATTTASIAVGGSTIGALEVVGDHDWYRIDLVAGQTITVTLSGFGSDPLGDPYLRFRNSSGSLLAENDDDAAGGLNSNLLFTATTSGTYYIDAGGFDEGFDGNYQLQVTGSAPLPVYTNDQIADYLIHGSFGSEGHHFDATQGGTITVNLTGLNSAGQFFARQALGLWSDIIGVTFSEVDIGGQIMFDDNAVDEAYCFTNWVGDYLTSAEVNVGSGWIAPDGTNLNSFSLQTYLHEIGHALGLGHGGDYNFVADYATHAHYANDCRSMSVMSYFGQTTNSYFGGQGFTNQNVLTPMMSDILAMSQLYGLSTTTRTGNTTYGFNSNAGRDVFNAALHPSAAYTIFDSGGIDTLNYSGYSAAQRIDLREETFSNIGAGIGNVAIARGTVIENAIGGSGNDVLIGNAAANILTGGAGSDTLNGSSGVDTASYAGAASAVTVNLALTTAQNTGGAGSDRLIAIESLTGSSFNDVLTGNSSHNILIGGLGNDVLNGGSGTDTASYASATSYVLVNLATTTAQNTRAGLDTLTAIERLVGSNFNDTLAGNSGVNNLYGGLGNDTIRGDAGNDVLAGEGGDDRMDGGPGNDRLSGSVGNDTAVYASATAAVTVTLALTTAQDTLGAGTDTLSSIERLSGSSFGDTLSGNTAVNVLWGEGGLDTLRGGSGNDVLYGGLGSDTLYGELGRDNFAFNAALASNVDRLMDYVPGYDKITLSHAIFTALGSSGTLAPSAFQAGIAAADALDRIIYDIATGKIYYDPDGLGGASQVQFAKVEAGLVLSAGDFYLVG